MFSLRNATFAAALIGAAASLPASAAVGDKTIPLGNSGWTAVITAAYAGKIGITIDGFGSDRVIIEKAVNFDDSFLIEGNVFDPAKITFIQTSPNAVRYIQIADEQLTNNTSYAWGSYRNFLLGGDNGGFPKFDVAQSAGFSVLPFATSTFLNGDKEFTASNGVVPAGGFFGQGDGPGDLVIDTGVTGQSDSLISFTLKEQPIPIPLPAAVWTGVIGLSSLGAFGLFKRARKAA